MTARRLAGLAGATALAAAALVAAPTAAPAVPADQTVVINCLGKGVVRPKQIVLACADAGVLFMNLRWTSWTANSATGTGTLVWNTCLPQTCVNGSVVKYNARITLGRVASGPTVTVFSKLTARFAAGGGPAGADTATFTLDQAPA